MTFQLSYLFHCGVCFSLVLWLWTVVYLDEANVDLMAFLHQNNSVYLIHVADTIWQASVKVCQQFLSLKNWVSKCHTFFFILSLFFSLQTTNFCLVVKDYLVQYAQFSITTY